MTEQRNILLITDDQHRWDFFGGGAIPDLRTPNLDRLRSEGTTLTNAYSNCPICMPTRFTWLHGLYASQAAGSLLRNASDWPTHLPTMAQALQQAGYHTALIGKLHSLGGLYHRDVVAAAGETRRRGFNAVFEVCGKSLAYWYDCQWTHYLEGKGLLERYRADVASRTEMIGGGERCEASFLDPEDHMDGFIGRTACNWLEAYTGRQPFFLHASLCGPHFPLDPSAPYLAHYRPEDMPPPEGVEDPVRIRHWQELRAAYCGLIEQVDDQVGRLLSMLEKRGWLDETLVVFTTDHGDMMGHRDRGHKGPPYDTSCRTPVTLRLPGTVPAGTVLPGPVEAVDLPCSLLAAAGLAEDAWKTALPFTPGRSYWEYACGHAGAPRDWAYAEFGLGDQAWRMCVDADWKYVYRANGQHELYHRTADPWEEQNLFQHEEQRQRRSEMQEHLLHSMSSIVAPDTDEGRGRNLQIGTW